MVANLPRPRIAYVLKITLLGTKPPIWRRFAVPGEITLDRLHDIIQIVMGWQDRHMHLFNIDGKLFSEKPEGELDGEEEKYHRICELVKAEATKIMYDYDFGDGWHHSIIVEQISEVPEGYLVLAKCLAGKRKCPPEDVGGTSGFADFVESCKNSKHPEHKRYLKWAGGSFDPDQFNLESVNVELFKYARWSRPRVEDDAFE